MYFFIVFLHQFIFTHCESVCVLCVTFTEFTLQLTHPNKHALK